MVLELVYMKRLRRFYTGLDSLAYVKRLWMVTSAFVIGDPQFSKLQRGALFCCL